MSLLNNTIFKAVREHADRMIAYGRGCEEDPSIPLFGAVVDTLDEKVRTYQVIPPPGIRINDFSWAGNNLMHDVPFLESLIALTRLTGDAKYEDAVDAVFSFYPKHCPHPETGLFPWGEHAQWSFVSRRALANCCHDPYRFVETEPIIHEHLRLAPAWFWERMWASNPESVVKFAKGLHFQLMNLDTFEHNRHAPFNGKHWNEIPYQGMGKDFARHAGFYILDCLFAYRKSGDPSLLEWARRKIAYQMGRRYANGILKPCIRRPEDGTEGQHDSFACSLYDAAKVLGEDTPEGREVMDAARELFDARIAKMKTLDAAPPIDNPEASAWNWSYGVGRTPLSGYVVNQQYDRTGDEIFVPPILRKAEWQMGVQPPGTEMPIVTWTFDANLRHLLDAYTITHEARYIERARTVALWALERVAPTGLFVGVINMEYFANINTMYSVGGSAGAQSERQGYYFSGTGVPSLLRHLLRLALLEEGEEDILGSTPIAAEGRMSRPNIIYIHSHDTGRYIQPYGHAVPTPNLQRLAEQGVLFRQAYNGGPTCSPSRACLLTGMCAHRNGMLGLAHRGFSLSDPRQHLAHTLKAAGYLTALSGAQHVTARIQDKWPTLGYDRYLGAPPDGHKHAVKFLNSGPSQPFFLTVGFGETHRAFPELEAEDTPDYCLPPSPLPDTPETRRDMAQFKVSARRLDRKMGEVFDALDANGLAENTLVICTTDHGIAFPRMKCNLTDSGIGVMLIMRGPRSTGSGQAQGFSGGKVTDALVSHIDLFPTICDVAGIDPPDWLEGTSVMPLIRGETDEVRDEIFSEVNYHAAYEPMRCARTQRWKYIRRFEPRTRQVLPNCDDSLSKTLWMEHGWRDMAPDDEQLYDLVFDPHETNNLAGDPAAAAALADMRARLNRWMRDTDDPLLKGSIPTPETTVVTPADAVSPKERVEVTRMEPE